MKSYGDRLLLRVEMGRLLHFHSNRYELQPKESSDKVLSS